MAHKQSTPQLPEVEQLLSSIESFQNGEFGHLKIGLDTLIGHKEWVDISTSPEEVHDILNDKKIDFIAVKKAGKLLGICSRSETGALLGIRSRNGSTHPTQIQDILISNPLIVSTGDSIVKVLTVAFNRTVDHFYDDLVLLDHNGNYLGLIYMRSLLILQNWVFMENIQRLKKQKETLNNQKQKMQQNMMLARQLQQAMLPRGYPSFPSHVKPEQSRLKFHHTYYNPDILGGDFFHIIYLSEYRAGLFMCDVLGHDVSSALITSMMRALLAGYRSEANQPGNFLTRINNRFIEMLENYPDTMYATANYLVVDVEKHQFEYASAGHPIPIRLNSRLGICSQLDITCQLNGPPLGILKEMTYESCSGSIVKGDLFLTYTDGLYEVFDRQNQQYGLDRLISSFSKHRNNPPQQIFKDVIDELEQFAQDKHFTDDVCLVGVEIAELV